MRYIITAVTTLIMLAFGVLGIGVILVEIIFMVREGFHYTQILAIASGILSLAICFWINDLQV